MHTPSNGLFFVFVFFSRLKRLNVFFFLFPFFNRSSRYNIHNEKSKLGLINDGDIL